MKSKQEVIDEAMLMDFLSSQECRMVKTIFKNTKDVLRHVVVML